MRLSDDLMLQIDVADWMRRTERFNDIQTHDERGWVSSTCPFHDDQRPSFAVNIETGVYKCQACGASGSFVNLVREIEAHDTLFDAEQHLIVTYGRFVPSVEEPLSLDFGDREEETFMTLPASVTKSEYLSSRGITWEVAKLFGARYALESLILPWLDESGRCITMKHRSTVDKRFWYDPPINDGRLRRLLFGYHLAKDAQMIVVVEGEIDAMSVTQAGFAAVALGSSDVTDARISVLRRAKAEEIVVFVDNPFTDTQVKRRDGTKEAASAKARRVLVDKLIGYKRVSVVDWTLCSGAKDANDVLVTYGASRLVDMIEGRVPCPLGLNIA